MIARLLTAAALLLAVNASAAPPASAPVAAPAPAPGKPPAAAPVAVPWGRLVEADGKTGHDLSQPSIVVGNAAPADVILAGPTVSGQHLRLSFQDGVVMAEELGSKFGTLLNGTLLKKGKPVRIVTRSSLALGAVTVTFEFGPRPGLVPPVVAPGKALKVKGKKK